MEVVAAAYRAQPTSKRLFIYDPVTKCNHLIDTGAEVSVMPPTRRDIPVDNNCQLFAANGSAIRTFGKSDVVLLLGLWRSAMETDHR